MDDALVEVTKADRDASASWIACSPYDVVKAEAEMIRIGQLDGHRLVQAFARARLAGVKEGLEMAGQYSLNVNETVQVKLTDAGREYHRKWHQRRYPMLAYRQPDESDDGWSKWQLWTLMRDFGAGVSMGGPVLFETTIRLDATAIRSLGPRP